MPGATHVFLSDALGGYSLENLGLAWCAVLEALLED